MGRSRRFQITIQEDTMVLLEELMRLTGLDKKGVIALAIHQMADRRKLTAESLRFVDTGGTP